jgi:hypothetical protein
MRADAARPVAAFGGGVWLLPRPCQERARRARGVAQTLLSTRVRLPRTAPTGDIDDVGKLDYR